tara:strand:- start:211 stop:423 length:213 start_codon:yes stop_codon:yes gene_type:complete
MLGIVQKLLKNIIDLQESIPEISDKINKQNADLNDITKEILGEEISEEMMAQINMQELNKEVLRRLGELI